MEIYTWMWLLAIKTFLSLTCPYTSKFGNALNLISLLGTVVFFVLVPFYAPHWWYIFVAIGIYLAVMAIAPRIDPNGPHGTLFPTYSAIGSHLSPIILILMYMSLFGVI